MENKLDISEEINNLKLDLDIIKRTDCSDTENQAFLEMLERGETLPENVHRYKNPANGSEYPEFYRIEAPASSPEEMNEYLQLLQCKYLKSIKWGIYFFVTITVISLIMGFIMILAGAN